jgi:hypothetical protein
MSPFLGVEVRHAAGGTPCNLLAIYCQKTSYLTFPLPVVQAFKFSLYLAVPICLTAFVVYTPENLQAIIKKVSSCSTLLFLRVYKPAIVTHNHGTGCRNPT